MYSHMGISNRIQWNLDANPTLNTFGTTITCAGSAHTKGAYSSGQLISSTEFDVYGIYLLWGATFTSATVTDMLMDIGIGASGSEVTIINNLQVGWSERNRLFLPLHIPKGTRIAARAQGIIASDTVEVGIFLLGGWSHPPFKCYSYVDAYGADTANSDGLTHTPGASGAFSSRASIGSTLAHNYEAFFPIISSNPAADTTLLASTCYVDIGHDSVTLGTFMFESFTNETWIGPHPAMPIHQPLASGEQMQIRAASSHATPESFEAVLYCLR